MKNKKDTPAIVITGVLKLALLKILQTTSILPLSIRYLLTDIFFMFAFLVSNSKRNAVKKNLRLILKRVPTSLEILNVFRDYGRYWAELPDINGFCDKYKIDVIGPDLPGVNECFLGVTFHIGNFEVFGRMLHSITSSNFTVVAEHLRPHFVFEFFRSIRLKHYIDTVPHDDPREILNALKRNGGLGVLIDRVVGGTGIETRLFCKRVMMPLNIVEYAVRNKIPIYVAYCVKKDGKLIFYSNKIDSSKYSFEQIVSRITSTIEGAVERYPFQWHVLSVI
jgi:lauroyl/myristoyl acyltransferase